MIYVVLDTNVIVSSFIIQNKESVPLSLLKFIFQKRNHVVPIFPLRFLKNIKKFFQDQSSALLNQKSVSL